MGIQRDEAFERSIRDRFGDLVNLNTCKNSDGDYMSWDAQVASYAWQAAQAVPEGFVLVSKERLAKAVDGIEALFKEDCTLALGELLPIQQDLNAMTEGLEYTKTELTIDWGMECPKCNHNEATCYSTATQESSYEFMDGDAVVCLKCGNKGEMDADGENSDIAWDEAQGQGQ